MAFLTLAGTTVEVQHDNATELEPTYLGEATRSFSGAYRSGVRGTKRSWTFTVIPGTQADLTALRTLLGAVDTPLTANGDFNGGVAVTVVARLGAVPYLSDGGTSFVRVAALTLLEV